MTHEKDVAEIELLNSEIECETGEILRSIKALG